MSRFQLWSGRTLSALAVLFLLFDVALHLIRPPFVVEERSRSATPST